jgi:hypothetical protein
MEGRKTEAEGMERAVAVVEIKRDVGGKMRKEAVKEGGRERLGHWPQMIFLSINLVLPSPIFCIARSAWRNVVSSSLHSEAGPDCESSISLFPSPSSSPDPQPTGKYIPEGILSQCMTNC